MCLIVIDLTAPWARRSERGPTRCRCRLLHFRSTRAQTRPWVQTAPDYIPPYFSSGNRRSGIEDCAAREYSSPPNLASCNGEDARGTSAHHRYDPRRPAKRTLHDQ